MGRVCLSLSRVCRCGPCNSQCIARGSSGQTIEGLAITTSRLALAGSKDEVRIAGVDLSLYCTVESI